MKRRPHFILGHAGAHGLTHFIDSHLAGMDGAAHGADFILVLDRAGMLGQHLPLQHLDTLLDQVRIADMFDLVDGKPSVIAAMPAHQRDHLVNEIARRVGGVVAGLEIKKTGTMPHLADKWQMRRKMLTIVKIPQHHVTLGRHKTSARRIVRDPELHVGGVGGVADI